MGKKVQELPKMTSRHNNVMKLLRHGDVLHGTMRLYMCMFLPNLKIIGQKHAHYRKNAKKTYLQALPLPAKIGLHHYTRPFHNNDVSEYEEIG